MRRPFRDLLFGAFATGVTLVLPNLAAAQSLIDARDPEALVEFLDYRGYDVDLGLDAYGDPMITGVVSASDFAAFFYGCTDNRDCTIIQFSHRWEPSRPLSLDLVNQWNVDELWGQAYLDQEGAVLLSFVLNMEGGVSRRNFEANLATWAAMVAEFEAFIGWTGGGSGKHTK
jgi:hypothetical protein